ncbi:MAG: 23S rRNA (uracil(1939)-C(5))-methyltransferase RlmD [Clostridia bacterium]|nr:23S rRNA (uracil(1939)-C(5))-methyltransferase RlmD [Clostridia bacterium]
MCYYISMKLQIDEININGEGLSHFEGKKYCTCGVLPGEIIEGTIQKETGNFAEIKLNKIIEPSLKRVEPKCKWCESCGGCDFMFVNEDCALEIKKKTIQKYFENFYSGDVVTHYSPKTTRYRNKVSFVINGKKIGLTRKKSNEIIEINDCLVAKEEIIKVFKIVKSYIVKNENSTINHLVVRVIDDKISVVLVCKNTPKNLDFLANELKKAFEEKFGLFLNFNTSSAYILSENWKYVCGQKEIISTSLGVKFFAKPHSFMQINDGVRDKIYKRVLQEIDGGIVIEGYSGAGLLSAVMAKRAKQVYAVEINKTANLDAEKLKAENNLNNLINLNGDCATILPKLVNEFLDATFVIDPPRSGIDRKIIDAILTSNVKKIIYISCNPYTLKQNIYLLKDKFSITHFEIFDIFPQTFNIESLVIMRKISNHFE